MPWPDIAILEEKFNGSLNIVAGDGTAVDADSLPTFTIYEDSVDNSILTGSYAKLDDTNTTGYYEVEITASAANGFERFKTYHVLSKATISSVDIQSTDSFMVWGSSDTFSSTSGALTTVSNFQDYTGVSGNDSLIAALINRATDAIENYCDRTFTSTTYREIRDGNSVEIQLDQYPVISVQLFSTSRQQAMTLENTSSDAYNAYVQITDSTMTLVVQGGANAGSNALTLDDSASITALRTAINALGAGWSAESISSTLELWDPIELLPVSGLNVLNNKIGLDVPDTPRSGYVIDDDTAIISNWHNFGSCFTSGHGNYGSDYYSHYDNYNYGRYTDYYRRGGIQNVIIRYTAGFATTPGDLEQICIDLTKNYYDAKSQSAALDQEKIGDYSYKLLSGGALTMPQGIRDRLEVWRRRKF